MIIKKFNLFRKPILKTPREGYDLWSQSYTNEKNPMLVADAELIDELLDGVELKNKSVLDIGCGTGRHWKLLNTKIPKCLVGCDVSPGMLSKLQKEFPKAKTYVIENEALPLDSDSFDVLLTTLTIGHIANIKDAISEWERVLKKKNSEIFITGYHPKLLQNDGNRTFKHGNKTISITNYIHTISDLISHFKGSNFQLEGLKEKFIDDQHRPFFEEKGALKLFEKQKGNPFIYSMHLKNMMNLQLNGLMRVGEQDKNPINLQIRDGKIQDLTTDFSGSDQEMNLSFKEALVFPSLINSHDHLEFNMFPRLGNSKYQDYIEWSRDVQSNYQTEISEVLSIPIDKRIQAGIYKNFFSGISHVANHGTYYKQYNNSIVNVIDKCLNLHSVTLEKYLILKLNLSKYGLPVVIHLNEGITSMAKKEVEYLSKWNLFRRKIIGVHGISLTSEQSANLEALVWCPDSNLDLYGKTSKVELIKNETTILFGTDSTLSANWNFWHQLRLARSLKKLNDIELFNAITKNAIKVWKLDVCEEITPGQNADLIIAKKKNTETWDAFYAINPEDILLIIKKGNIICVDESILSQVSNLKMDQYVKVDFKSHTKFVKTTDPIPKDELLTMGFQ